MPLSANDPNLDYPGSWGDASEGWCYLAFPDEDKCDHAMYIGWKYAKVPYGAYVVVGNHLRLEQTKYLGDVLNALKEHPYYVGWKNDIRS